MPNAIPLLLLVAPAVALAQPPSTTTGKPRLAEARAPLPAPASRAPSTPVGAAGPSATPTRSLAAQALASQESARAASPLEPRGDDAGDPGSLLAVRAPEPRAFAVHDLVTIVVSESSRSKSAADAKAEKDYEVSAAVDAWISMDPASFGNGFFSPLSANELPAAGAQGDKYFRGKGNYARSDDFTARVTAEVVEVRPNGLLVLEARREIQMDGETQVITLSGVCRPDDVDANNSVLSQRVADAVIRKTTTGQLRDTAEKGALAKLLDAIFAF